MHCQPSALWALRPALRSSLALARRRHLTLSSKPVQNQIFDPVRYPDTLSSYITLSTGSDATLLTLWAASWCPSCRTVEPLVTDLVRSGVRVGGASSSQGSPVNLVRVDFDSPDIAGHELSTRYIINSIPTLLAFDPRRGEPAARLTDVRAMSDRAFLEKWIRELGGGSGGGDIGGGGGGGATSFFGGLFGR